MSKYNLSWDEKKLKKYIAEGRGQGTGKDYKPWITVHDFPSKGIASRQPGWKSGRVCHFLSNHELRYFFLLEWSDMVTDIREQYPMNTQETLDIADKLSIKHPEDRQSKVPYVMTTDFFITLNVDGKEVHKARTIKPASELEKKNVLEHFEIERRYWAGQGIDWGIVTDKDIPKMLVSNIEWVYFTYKLEPIGQLDVKTLLYFGEILKERLEKSEGRIVQVTSNFDKEMQMEPGTALYIFKHLIARKEITMDMSKALCAARSTDCITRIIKKNDRMVAI